MPRLPDFQTLGQTPAPQTPLSVARVDVSPLEFTVRQGPGEAMIRGGHQLTDAGIQMQDHIDTLMAEDAYNKLITKRIDLESSPQNGFQNVKGSAAIDRKFYDDYNQRFTDSATAIEGGLGNANQRRLFQGRAAIAGAQYQSALLTHMSKETSSFADNTEKTSVALEVANASNAPNDAMFDTSITRIRGILDARGSRLNEPPAETELNKLKAVDSAWTERIRTTMNNDPLLAQKMYDENKAKIGPDNKVILEHQLHQAVLPVQAKNLAMSIIAGAKVDDVVKAVTVGGDNVLNNIIHAQVQVDNEGAPETKVKTKANLAGWIADAGDAAQRLKPNDPVFRDLVVQQVKGYVATIMTAQDGISKLAHGALTDAATFGNDIYARPMTLDQLLTTNDLRAAWRVLTPEGQRGINSILEHNARAAQGVPIKVNSRVVEQLFDRIHLPAEDPNRITSWTQLSPFFGRGLDIHYYDWLKKEVTRQGTEDGRNLTTTREDYLKGVKGQFDSSTLMNMDVHGGERFNKFRTFVLGEEDKAINSGGKVNAYDLYNYKSPLYISNKIPAFQATLEQQMRNMNDRMRTQAPTVTPAPQAPAQAPAQPPITATNAKTKEQLISTDGGKTWQKKP